MAAHSVKSVSTGTRAILDPFSPFPMAQSLARAAYLLAHYQLKKNG